MKNIRNILWGFVFLIIGILATLNILELTHINYFFDGWWTLLIMIPSFIDLFKKENKIYNIIVLIIAFILLLCCRSVLDIYLLIKLFIPTVLIIVGLYFIIVNIRDIK